ncbi:hypothetical protein EV144_101801 [Flavobacterium sp. 270]|uniref:hypothetical protein n=1 Tax=Flavobacterium sp. 270 TaxID=2512114 RepID=UPI0010E6383D|nr:hypothetical protein [Flavobacterium sp. 270]TDW52118.1 hypothetical protein EV144_101801 [Flavobacterium sp. 270]
MMDFYTFIQLLIVSIIATAAMTSFSCFMSKQFQELYKEPVLLSFVLSKLKMELSVKSEKILGWLLHFLIGFLFVLAYYVLWVKDILPISTLSALLLGAISGIIGIICWMFIFKMSNHQPHIDFKGYYLQLFFAHIIFAIIATAFYSLSLTF